jgi:chemotaxis regulatin CheY-phosphate phosphatase CheZ
MGMPCIETLDTAEELEKSWADWESSQLDCLDVRKLTKDFIVGMQVSCCS